jgi:hypothetical protein
MVAVLVFVFINKFFGIFLHIDTNKFYVIGLLI